MTEQNLNQSEHNDFDVVEFFRVIWEGKKLIIVFSFLIAILAGIYSSTINDYYSSQVILIPSDEENKATNSSISGIASFAGIDLGSGKPDKTKEALAILKSRKFIIDFIKKHELEVPILAAKKWDKKNSKLVIDKSIYDEENQSWLKEFNVNDAHREFLKIYSISTDILGTGLITIKINYISPQMAKYWVEQIVIEVNARFKEFEINNANRSIAYLNSELEKPNLNMEQKRVLYSLIQGQTNNLVLANGRDEYMFRTVDPAYVPDKKAGPMRSIYILIAFFTGSIISIFILFIAFYNKTLISFDKRLPWIKVQRI